jgi:hypothetical protein
MRFIRRYVMAASYVLVFLVSAHAQLVTGACGSSNGAILSSSPTANLCSSGTASTVSGSGPWSWDCFGNGRGTTAICSALEVASAQGVSGACGSSNGATLTSAPTANLCTAGAASTVSGSGPWYWNCAGSSGGATTSCSASLNTASSGSGGSTSQSAALFPAMGSQTSSVYPWAQYPPGVTYNGGIPARTTQCGPTLTPLGGGASDAAHIKSAILACPAGQHVQLGTGVFVFNASDTIGINNVSNVTVRGMGPGPGGAIPDNQSSIPNISVCGATPCTILYNRQWATANGPFFSINPSAANVDAWLGTSINLASNAAEGATTLNLASAPPTGAQFNVGSLVYIDQQTCNGSATPTWPTSGSPELYYTRAFGSYGTAPWDYYGRRCRQLAQVDKVTNITGNVVTLESPLSVAYTVSHAAQVTPWCNGCLSANGFGIEEMYLYGGVNGNVTIEGCIGCWVKHVESHWHIGASIGFSACYRCELRDSYLHESALYTATTSGGAGYLLSLDEATANSLVENNIIWNGDKEIVMRMSGGGNVIAYNYMDDSWDSASPSASEAGVNAGHFLGSHMELIEGNWSQKYSGDSWWGNAIYITAFRNQFSGRRSAHSWLATFINGNGYPYCDCWDRSALSMMDFQWWDNIVGNILGYSGQAYIYGQLWPPSRFMSTQNHFRYEAYPAGGGPDNTAVTMYEIGSVQDGFGLVTPNDTPADPNMYQRTNRQGNYDFVTNSQIWYATYGGTGTTSTGSAQTLPNSLYLASKPAFFGSYTWPWVVPSTGTTYTLPAKARYDNGTPNKLP